MARRRYLSPMTRFDRIVTILLQLQSRRVVRGTDLAVRFGVSLRTVYRDLRTLEVDGVPLCGEAGVGAQGRVVVAGDVGSAGLVAAGQVVVARRGAVAALKTAEQVVVACRNIQPAPIATE